MPFRQVDASLFNKDHFMRDLIDLQLHNSLKVIRHSVCKRFALYLLYFLLQDQHYNIC